MNSVNSGGMVVSSAQTDASITTREMTSAPIAATSASSRPSVTSCLTIRPREAPSDKRTPISRCRTTPRASRRFATLAQAMTRIRPNAMKSGENPSTTPAESGVAVRRDSSRMVSGWAPTGRPSAV